MKKKKKPLLRAAHVIYVQYSTVQNSVHMHARYSNPSISLCPFTIKRHSVSRGGSGDTKADDDAWLPRVGTAWHGKTLVAERVAVNLPCG